ncbi:hypothetical protein L226DRAFT_324333 [Lentinus tigrinus ALCF2SS1-7]|nr:hypothetical protein L226DRAFT_324333 [Lentinus tigrinus ALCF2SS1-7]
MIPLTVGPSSPNEPPPPCHPTYEEDNQLYEDEPDDPQAQAQRSALWEAHFRRLSTECFESEKMAYEHRVLQGTAISRLLLTGAMIPPDERAIQPPAIVLEYVPDAVSLRDDADLYTTLAQVIDSFSTYSVCHTEIHRNNILFTPREHPNRAFAIEFGCAAVREDEDDGSWETTRVFWNDGRRFRRLLQEKGIAIEVKEELPVA